MLTAADDYPVHQTPEPIALVTDRNFYDRYFFNGYSPDGSIFFAAAMGIYPALDVIDAAFCVTVDAVQHNLRASARLSGERMVLRVGPISIEVNVALSQLTLLVAPNDSGIAAELRFTGRHFPVEEPRFTRRVGTRLFMDYTRMTQNGRWSGWFEIAGNRHAVDARYVGTRDRSWGIRPVGKPDAQPAPVAPQFFWLWTPCNFDHFSLFLHTNDDGHGRPWNRRAVIWRDGEDPQNIAKFDASAIIESEAPDIRYDWAVGSRRVRQITCELGEGTRLTLTPMMTPAASRAMVQGHFYMNGLGYTHPIWGHGMDHGDIDVAYDTIDLATVTDGDFANLHVQTMASAVLEQDGRTHHGRGVIEQFFIGPHADAGLTGLFDPVTG